MIRVIILCILGISASAEVTNYCDLPDSVCPSKLQHIACENNGDFSSKCGSDSIFEALSNFQKNKILDYQNLYRNVAAAGLMPFLVKMKPMVTLQWDDELADIAAYIAKTCEKTLEKCYKTCRFPLSKQFVKNYAYNSENSYFRNILNGLKAITSRWRSNTPNPDFNLMITDHHTHVGCAAVVYGTEEERNMQLVCNYGSSRTSCLNVRNSEYLYLCSPEESVFEELC